jgi:hypothetical protein
MQYLIITEKPVGESNLSLLFDNLIVTVACKELSSARKIYHDNRPDGDGMNKVSARIPELSGSGFQLLCKDEIIRIEEKQEQSIIFCNDNSTLVSVRDLELFAERLIPFMFFRVNPYHLVNLMYMERLNRSAASIVLTNSESVPVSAKTEIELLKLFNQTDLL